MASTILLAAAAFTTIFLFSCAASHPTSDLSSNYTAPTGRLVVDIVVEGMVYCQNCTHHGSWSLAGAETIAAAKVSVICRNYKKRVTYYKTFETNPYGYFYGELKGFKMVHPVLDHPLHGCRVKLVSSPLASCEMPSNINYGMDGASLRFEEKRLYGGERYEAVIYAAGPLAFRPASCPRPQIHA
ncbi:hypothetical protein MLD38_008676 [Melastoma candidum]|uniref:Uncharacterized protein n=1 Tax=Melastoma candidum TaxID=119954 RepID=A0ACB9RWD9_9MYRT|nr:hypothetical protein MLD38_008676 [Melastoma candidum]